MSGYRRKNWKEKKIYRSTFIKIKSDVYYLKREILPNKRIFPINQRAVYNVLEKVTNYLGYKNVSTHFFRRFFATNIYESSGSPATLLHNIVNKLIRQLLNVKDSFFRCC